MNLVQYNRVPALTKYWGILPGLFLFALNVAIPMKVYSASVTGIVQWNKRVEITTTVSGKVKEVLVSPGSLVTKKQVLIRLDSTLFDAQLKLAKAEYKKQAHVYKEAKKELSRQKELYDRTVISTHDLELSKIAHTQALSNLKQAQAKLTLARFSKSESILRAPFNAVVIALQVQPGSVVNTRLKAQTMVVLGEHGKMKVVANIDLSAIRTLGSGQTVKVMVNGKKYNGKITVLGYEPVTQGAKPLYRLGVVFDVPGQVLRVGQTAVIQY